MVPWDLLEEEQAYMVYTTVYTAHLWEHRRLGIGIGFIIAQLEVGSWVG
jgi:hypothetical protein